MELNTLNPNQNSCDGGKLLSCFTAVHTVICLQIFIVPALLAGSLKGISKIVMTGSTRFVCYWNVNSLFVRTKPMVTEN